MVQPHAQWYVYACLVFMSCMGIAGSTMGCSAAPGSGPNMDPDEHVAPTDSLPGDPVPTDPVPNDSVAADPFERLSADLQGAIDVWAGRSNHRGVSAAVILADGSEWVGVAGEEGRDRLLKPEHLIWIASITKSMTGAVMLTLAEGGVLSLEDSVSQWLGPIPNVDPAITLRQLLNHTNGLANYTRSPNLGPAIVANPAHVFTPDELLTFVGPKIFEPGQRTQYTNTSFLLLGLIAEAATGRSIVTLYHNRLWQPLGLSEIFLPGSEEAPTPVAQAWRGSSAEEEVAPLDEMSLLTIGQSAFGLFSNARTIARWGRALFTQQVFGEAMHAEMVRFAPAAGNIPGESGVGLGIRRYSYFGREQWGHSGGSPLGSSLMFYDPDTGITVAVLMNQGAGAQHFDLAPQLLDLAAKN